MKLTYNKIIRYIVTGLLIMPLVLASLSAQARPGTLSNIPLFLSTGVDPNIVFLTDDSGSMDWTLMTDESDGIMYLYYAYYYTHPAPDNDYFWIVATEESLLSKGEAAPAGGVWRAWNSSYNRLYYDPTITYEPWKGVDNSGATYANSSPTAARYNPYSAAAGTTDLTAVTSYNTDYGLNPGLGYFTVTNFYPARYYTWTDSDGDGAVDADDAHTLVEIRSTTPTYTGGANREDCAAAPVCTYAEEIQNFANWYTYYRKREYVAKNAVTSVVTPMVGTRVGYGTINNINNVKIKVAAMNSDVASGNKKTLFDKVYNSNSVGGTPLRENLRNVGRYYECASNNFFGVSGSDCPIISAADGGMCQQNFTILMTDGYYNGSSPSLSPSNTDYDNNTDFDGGSYADPYSNTLADVTMHYYERDLNTSLSDLVPVVPGVDEADHQHMVTYTVAFGVSGTLDPFDTKTPGVASDTDPTDGAFDWPNPSSGNAQKIDDLWHAAYNGRGQFLSAQNPTELNESLGDAISSIADRTSSAAAVAFNSTSLGTDSVVYFARFLSSTWSGELFAHTLNPFTGAIASSPSWNAATALDAQSPASRQIITYNDDTGAGVTFKTLGGLSTKQQNDLNMGPSGADGLGQDRIDYLRGDRSNEGTGNNFRVRSSVLGDIIHSNPVYVGKPQMNYPANFPDAGYDSFKSTNAGRHGIIYVGANDGMLHGFDEDTGAEVFAYVPNVLFSNSAGLGLHYLTDPGYSHRYYVDQSPVVADVYLGGAWKTILVGGLRGGGQGLFALDVTDPSTLNEGNAATIVLGEFTTATTNLANLGYTYSKPTIARLNNGKWAAIVGNGYNNSGDGKAYLFVIYLDGTAPVKIAAGSSGSLADPNGLSAPGVVDNDGDGVADFAYAGDLYGSLYKFDLSGFTATTLFTGTKPITSKPVATRHPTESGNNTSPNILVFFGTGQYLVEADKTNTTTQTFYGLWDGGSNSAISESDANAWLEQTYTTSGDYRIVTDLDITYGTQSSKHKGWKINFTGGERIVADPLVRGDFVIFTTMIPDTTVCSYGGSGWIMGVKLINGGMPEDPLWDINNDGVFDDDDLVGADDNPPSGVKVEKGMPNQAKVLSNLVYVTDTSGDTPDDPLEGDFYDGPGEGRLSWREIRSDN